MKMRAEIGVMLSASQGVPASARKPLEAGESHGSDSLSQSSGGALAATPGLSLAASRAVRQYFSAVEVTQPCGPRKLAQLAYENPGSPACLESSQIW